MDKDLPFVDEYEVLVSAPPAAVWRALTGRFSGLKGAGVETFAKVLGAEPGRASGGEFGAGTTLPGFRVEEAVVGERLVLLGRHRFSRYRLVMTLAETPGGTLFTAQTYAVFPGPHGFVYRQLVITSQAHHLIVQRLLRKVARKAEAHAVG